MNEKFVKIRKPRRCHGCLCLRQPGQTMERGKHFDNKAFSIYFCTECVDVLKIIPPDFFFDGIEEGDIRDWVKEEFENE